MSIEALLEAAKYLEYRSQASARGEEPIDYATYNRSSSEPRPAHHSLSHPSASLIPNSLLRLEDIQEKRRSSSSDTREVHNKLEKYRRAHLKDCFETLRKQLPNAEDKKSSNLNILKAAIRCIQNLKRQERDYEHEMERLAREKIAAQQKLAALKRELAMQFDHTETTKLPPQDDHHDSNTSTASECGDNDDQETLSASSPVSQREQQLEECEEDKPKLNGASPLQAGVATIKTETVKTDPGPVAPPCNCTGLVLLPTSFPLPQRIEHQACTSSPTKSKCSVSSNLASSSSENHVIPSPIKVDPSSSVGFSLGGSRAMVPSPASGTFITPQSPLPRPVLGAVTVISSVRPSTTPLHVIATTVPSLTTVRPSPSPIHVIGSSVSTLNAPIKFVTSVAGATSTAKLLTPSTCHSSLAQARMISSPIGAGPINLSKDANKIKESLPGTGNLVSVRPNGTVTMPNLNVPVGVMTPVTPLMTPMGVPVIAPAQLSKVVGIGGLGYSLASPVTSGLVKPLVVVSSNPLSAQQNNGTEMKKSKPAVTTHS